MAVSELKTTRAVRSAAYDLAAAWSGFSSARWNEDYERVVTWGRILRDAQIKLGVSVYNDKLLGLAISEAEAKSISANLNCIRATA